MNRHHPRLVLQYLDDRLVPSNSDLINPVVDSPSIVQSTPLAEAKATPVAIINFALLPSDQLYKLKIKVVTAGGTNTYEETFTIDNLSPKNVRDMVYDSLTSAGWTLTKVDDDKIKIGYRYLQTDTYVGSVGIAAEGLKDNQQPRISTSSGVQRGQLSDGGKWKFGFSASPAASVFEDDTIARFTIDGVQVNILITAGMTPQQANQLVANNLIMAGVSDVIATSHGVEFLQNTQSQEALTVNFELIDVNGHPIVDWMQADLTIAQRTIIA